MTEAEWHKLRADKLEQLAREMIMRLFDDEEACRDLIAAFYAIENAPAYNTREWQEVFGIPFTVH
jgi:hypothetical protein